jgi:hypothetical protein
MSLLNILCTFTVFSLIIDISWVDYLYKASICDVMYFRQRRHFQYIMVATFRNTICPPPPFYFIGGPCCRLIQKEHNLYNIADEPEK